MISVIITTYNEADTIKDTIAYVYANASYKRLLKEVIVVDHGSTDGTIREAEKTGATVVVAPKKEKAAQLNYGAFQASGDVLYFLPSRSTPPPNFLGDIVKATLKGYACGTFALRYDDRHWTLRLLSWMANRFFVCLSDQSLFVSRSLFLKAGGFREDHLVMINQELIRRARRYTDFVILDEPVLASAHRYRGHGILKTELVQGVVYILHRCGCPQRFTVWLYRNLLGWKIGPEPERSEAAEVSVDMQVAVEETAFSNG